VALTGQFKADGKAAQVQGARSAELALFAVYDSPVCCVCDHPSHYRDQPGADFLKIVPTVWDDTRVPDGAVAEHLVIARRSGDRWLFAWQEKYGAFSVSVSQLDKIIQYIGSQAEHHRKMTFQEEFAALLKKHRLEYDPRYLWD